MLCDLSPAAPLSSVECTLKVELYFLDSERQGNSCNLRRLITISGQKCHTVSLCECHFFLISWTKFNWLIWLAKHTHTHTQSLWRGMGREDPITWCYVLSLDKFGRPFSSLWHLATLSLPLYTNDFVKTPVGSASPDPWHHTEEKRQEMEAWQWPGKSPGVTGRAGVSPAWWVTWASEVDGACETTPLARADSSHH